MTKPIPHALVTALLLVSLSGCNALLTGDWRSIEPSDTPPDILRIRQIHFDGQTRFEARLLRHHRISTISGTYRFTAEQLILTPDEDTSISPLVYYVESVGDVLILHQGNYRYRLMREADGSMTATPAPALLDPATQPASATTQPQP